MFWEFPLYKRIIKLYEAFSISGKKLQLKINWKDFADPEQTKTSLSRSITFLAPVLYKKEVARRRFHYHRFQGNGAFEMWIFWNWSFAQKQIPLLLFHFISITGELRPESLINKTEIQTQKRPRPVVNLFPILYTLCIYELMFRSVFRLLAETASKGVWQFRTLLITAHTLAN